MFLPFLRPRWLPVPGVFVLIVACCLPVKCLALTPESPEVKAAVAKGVKYLAAQAATDERTGAQALAGLAI